MEILLLNALLHVFNIQCGCFQVAPMFRHPRDDSYNLFRYQDFDLAKVLCILGYVSLRIRLLPASNVSQEDQLILDWMVHQFLVATNLVKIDSVFLEAIGLRNTTDPWMYRIGKILADYTVGKTNGVGNDNRASNGNAPATLPPTQDGFSLAQRYRTFMAQQYFKFSQAERPFRNQQYNGGLSPAQQYQYRPFSQTEQSTQNMQYDGHMFPPQYMMERAANSTRASTAGQSHANSARFSTTGQPSGLSDLGFFSNSE